MSKQKRIYLSSPHMGGEELEFIQQSFDTNWIAPLGANVNGFEKDVASYLNTADAAALVSGTSAIHLGLKALGVKQGDLVFCSSLTFSASANPILYLEATPVFIDSEYETWNMDPQALEKAFEEYPNPKAVIVVDLYGQSADYDRILEICEAHNTPVLEDAAEALGSSYNGRKCGTFGELGVLSFNGNKIITTSGGGMLVGNDIDTIAKARFWSTQSREPERWYEHKELGYNYRMSNIVAGIGRGQMEILDERVSQKNRIYEVYEEAFADIPEITMMPRVDRTNCWLSVMTLDPDSKVKPLDIMVTLEAQNIESRPVWKPMHLQPFFKKFPFFTVSENGSIAEDLFYRGVCLPSDTKMNREDIDEVITIIRGLFE